MDPPRRKDILAPEGSIGVRSERRKVPIHPLFVLYDMIHGQQCKILKDDGYNTNIVSRDFIRRNEKYFKIINQKPSIEHSNEDSSEQITGVVVDAIVQIGKHQYQSSWAIFNCRYDLI